jgi:CrcB protein
MTNILLVGMGGFIGSVARYLLSGWVYRFLNNPWFPYGTLVVNVVGCLLIGLLAGLAESRQIFSGEVRLFLLIGMLGGFTTFSTFGYETFALLRDGQFLAMAANVGAQVVFGLLAVWLGYVLSRLF